VTDLLKFITCGSVDDGKSTLIGHILYDSKLIYADQAQALLLDSQIGSRGGEIDYSLLLDGLMAEREQGITIDVAYRYFTTEKRSFIAADAPGHEQYTRNMAVGASFADLAIILIDATRGVLRQTRRHARICSMMGIRSFLFAVNKMDLANYSEESFESIKSDVDALKRELNLQSAALMPLSATAGDNVTTPSVNMPWYSGPTLLEFLEEVETAEIRDSGLGFAMPIQRVCRPDASFRGFQGQVESGSAACGDTLTVLPSMEKAKVKALYLGECMVPEIFAGQPATIQLDRELDASKGCVLAKDASLKSQKRFAATLLWMDDAVLALGREYWVKVGTKLLPAKVESIEYKIDVNTGDHLPANVLEKNEIALCRIEASENLVVDLFRNSRSLGSLILIDRLSHATSACGVIEEIGGGRLEGVVFDDGKIRVETNLFDLFLFNPLSGTIERVRPEPSVYRLGDELPLKGRGYAYPGDFDAESEKDSIRIRNSRFAGFGPHESSVPLLSRHGLGVSENGLDPFEMYRSIIYSA
jgi:sulfate adenylyltransferase subunit 1